MRILGQFQRTFALLLTTAMILSLCLSTSARASITGSFEIGIDQNLIVLDGKANIKNLEAAIAEKESKGHLTGHLQDSLEIALRDDLMLAAMWRPYTSVLLEREHPGVLLSNTKDSNANIVSMELSLANPLNQFMPFGNGNYIQESIASGEYKLIDPITYNYQWVDPDQVPVSASVLDGGKRLALSFGNGGIKPGRATTFNVYSSTGMDLFEFFDRDSLLTIVYEDPLTSDTVSKTTSLGDGMASFNNDLVSQLLNGTSAGGIHFRDSVEAYFMTTKVPEPTSLLLLGSGLGIFVLRGRRRGTCGV